MTPEKVKQVLADFKVILNEEARRIPDADYKFASKVWTKDARGHAAWMCDEAAKFVDEGRMEKAMRWLGFINAVLWITGLRSLDSIKYACMPDGVLPSITDCAITEVEVTKPIRDTEFAPFRHIDVASIEAGLLEEFSQRNDAKVDTHNSEASVLADSASPVPWAVMGVDLAAEDGCTPCCGMDTKTWIEAHKHEQLSVRTAAAKETKAKEDARKSMYLGTRAHEQLSIYSAAAKDSIAAEDVVITSASDAIARMGRHTHERLAAEYAVRDAKKTLDMIDEAIIKLSEPPPVKHVLGVYNGEPNTIVHSLDELNVERTWVLSSKHVESAELGCMSDSDDVEVHLDSHGDAITWTINVDYTDVPALREDLETLFGEHVVNIAMTAQALGFQRVRFDVDGDVLPAFPVFDD